MKRQHGRHVVLPLLSWAILGVSARGEIYRRDNGEVIPGTEGITPAAGVDLSFRNLEYADLSDFPSIDLTNANFHSANLQTLTSRSPF